MTVLPTRHKLVDLAREGDGVHLTLMSNQLLSLHCDEVPDACDSVELRRRQEVCFIGVPIEVRDDRVKGIARAAVSSALLDVAEMLR